MTFDGFLTPIEDHPRSDEIAAALVDAAPPIPAVAPPRPVEITTPSGPAEPLVEVSAAGVATLPAYDGSRTPRGNLPVRLRRSVVDRLVAAQDLLPPPFSLTVLDGWRDAAFQQELVEFYGADAVEAGYVSAVGGPDAATPPHVTGGAVDLTLAWRGDALALGTAFDSFRDRAHVDAVEHEVGPARDARRLLLHALTTAGFAPYRWEWWHFSHGDSLWARWAGAPAPLFGPAESASQ